MRGLRAEPGLIAPKVDAPEVGMIVPVVVLNVAVELILLN